MPENRNKPEKLDLPKAPKVNQEGKWLNELPFSLQLQQMKANVEKEVLCPPV